MGILILFVGMVIGFVILPFFVMRLFCDMCRISNGQVRLLVWAILAYATWDHFQLPKEDTASGHVWRQTAVTLNGYGPAAAPSPGTGTVAGPARSAPAAR